MIRDALADLEATSSRAAAASEERQIRNNRARNKRRVTGSGPVCPSALSRRISAPWLRVPTACRAVGWRDGDDRRAHTLEARARYRAAPRFRSSTDRSDRTGRGEKVTNIY